MPEAAPLSVNDVLRWPGMFGDQSLDYRGTSVPACLALAGMRSMTLPPAGRAKAKNWPP